MKTDFGGMEDDFEIGLMRERVSGGAHDGIRERLEQNIWD